jgi:hypothetical protein
VPDLWDVRSGLIDEPGILATVRDHGLDGLARDAHETSRRRFHLDKAVNRIPPEYAVRGLHEIVHSFGFAALTATNKIDWMRPHSAKCPRPPRYVAVNKKQVCAIRRHELAQQHIAGLVQRANSQRGTVPLT